MSVVYALSSRSTVDRDLAVTALPCIGGMSNPGLLAICNITHIKPPVSEQTLADLQVILSIESSAGHGLLVIPPKST
jgi:hypothetical protein